MAKSVKKIVPTKRIGMRVVLTGIEDPGSKLQDADMNGMTGKLVKKFKYIPFGQVGIVLDKQDSSGIYKANIMWRDCELI